MWKLVLAKSGDNCRMQLHTADVDLVDPDHDIVRPLGDAGVLVLGQMLAQFC